MNFIAWGAFLVLIAVLLALDLGVFHKKDSEISTKEALIWTVIWVAFSMCFNVVVYFAYDGHWFGLGLGADHATNGKEAALAFFTAYVVEKSLSLDNIFVIALVFKAFSIPRKSQHRVLFWGVLGALIMRGAMILAGTAAIKQFDWLLYLFGGFLIITGGRLFFSKDGSDEDGSEIRDGLALRLIRRWLPTTNDMSSGHFFVKENGKRFATPLFFALVTVEITDAVFAVDSVPAVFGVTLDPWIAFTSNVLAILGLRSLFFALAAMLDKFRYLKFSLASILIFVGVKMVIAHHVKISAMISLSIIGGLLALGVVASLWAARSKRAASDQTE